MQIISARDKSVELQAVWFFTCSYAWIVRLLMGLGDGWGFNFKCSKWKKKLKWNMS